MNKRELIEIVAKQVKVTKADAERFIDVFMEVASKRLKAGEDVKLVGFGTFTRRTRKARNGRNPRTGEAIAISAMKYVKFVPGTKLKELVK